MVQGGVDLILHRVGGAYEKQIQLQRLDTIRIIFDCTTDIHLLD